MTDVGVVADAVRPPAVVGVTDEVVVVTQGDAQTAVVDSRQNHHRVHQLLSHYLWLVNLSSDESLLQKNLRTLDPLLHSHDRKSRLHILYNRQLNYSHFISISAPKSSISSKKEG